MRVTDVTKQVAVMKNMNNNAEDLQTLMTNISSGKRINKPSDDPVGAIASQDYRTSINHMETISRNINADKVWLNATETVIKQMADLLQSAKKTALEAANGPSSPEARTVLAKEMNSFLDEIIRLGNAREGKLYLLSGTRTFTKPLERMQNLKEAEINYTGTRLKSQRQMQPVNQNLPCPNIKQGSLKVNLYDDETGELVQTMDVVLNGNETVKQLEERFNSTAAQVNRFAPDKNSPTGYKAELFAQIGVDNHFYIDPAKGLRVEFGEDTTGVVKRMNFGVVGQGFGTETELPKLDEAPIPYGEYLANFDGYSDRNYIVRMIEGGTYGTAKYIVSDNGGVDWSQPQYLRRRNDIYNPDNLGSSKLFLKFEGDAYPFFKEGVEFHFDGNPIVTYHGNDQIKDVLVDNNIRVPLNITARQVLFKGGDEEDRVNVFDVLHRLAINMLEDDQEGIMKGIDGLEVAQDQVLSERAKVGVTMRKLGASEERIDSMSYSKTRELSELEDLDLPKAITDLNTAELRHKASLDTTARLIQPTLLQFLR